MLGKLLKYEWKSTYKICGAFLIFMAIMTVLGCISFHTPMWTKMFADKTIDRITAMDFMGIIMLVFYVLSIIGVVYGTLIFLGIHFFKSMYSEEGYLTHTLPVTSHQILISKILISGLWYLIVILTMMISCVVLLYSLANQAFVSVTNSISLWSYIRENWSEIWEELQYFFGFQWDIFTILQIILLLIGPFASIITLFGAITIGQISSKHKVLMSIVSYFGITIIVRIVSALMMMPIYMIYAYQMISYRIETISTVPVFLVNFCITVVTAVILYFLSHYIITKKLNLE